MSNLNGRELPWNSYDSKAQANSETAVSHPFLCVGRHRYQALSRISKGASRSAATSPDLLALYRAPAALIGALPLAER